LSIVSGFGNLRRVWPTTTKDCITFTVGVARPFIPSYERRLLIYQFNHYRNKLKLLADFHVDTFHVDTSGQPYFSNKTGLFIPAWNSDYYVYGRTYFKIFRSQDFSEFQEIYVDPAGTYGNHFFSDESGNQIYIGVGRGWKGTRGTISYTPLNSYLLGSEDGGEHWSKIYELKYPTAIYDGVKVDDLIIFSARERNSIFVSFDNGKNFKEISFDSPTRNVIYYRKGRREFFIVSSNDSFYLSTDAVKFTTIKVGTKGLVLRYPTILPEYCDNIYFAGVGPRSWLLAIDLKLGKLKIYDLTKLTRDVYAARLTVLSNLFFIGSELKGKLYLINATNLNEPTMTDFITLYAQFLTRLSLRRLLALFTKNAALMSHFE
jgi:hypothetical protein